MWRPIWRLAATELLHEKPPPLGRTEGVENVRQVRRQVDGRAAVAGTADVENRPQIVNAPQAHREDAVIIKDPRAQQWADVGLHAPRLPARSCGFSVQRGRAHIDADSRCGDERPSRGVDRCEGRRAFFFLKLFIWRRTT